MSENNKPDRYVSFQGIDCSEKARKTLNVALELTASHDYKNKFWDLFRTKYEGALCSETTDDDLLYLVCSSVYYLEELFEAAQNNDGLELLEDCEFNCC